ncbi:MAG: HEAT repeat domain-containing protein [Fimbriimonadaceae bacterium]|nr:HEAT repeat domain-containing protein [Fimbriimonadaceae bacterium]
MNSSPFEGTKQAAMIEAGRLGDPVFAGALSRQFASNSWQTRLAAAKALTMLPGDEAAVISMTFLQEIDPEVRWTVTCGANTANSVVVKRMLWSAVNDPSDAVRAMSCWKLIESGKPKDASEGYKGVRDDSIGVRLELVQRMGASPSPKHRDALLVAIADSSWLVRAAALSSLAKQSEPVKVDEIGNVLEDKFPAVQLALLDLAKAKSLSLPPAAIANLKTSLDARVVERVKELGL